MKTYRALAFISVALILVGCGSLVVRQVDLDAWVDQPVAALEMHPVFLTIPVVKTVASDGTEIWNFVNGADVGGCSNGGAVFGGTVNFATYTSFSNCMARKMACNNIFYIKDKTVKRYVPVGTGGARCVTDERLQPKFLGPTNIR
jgi:hypothetical protein